MDKYEELKLESAKRMEHYRELVKRIERREKIVDKISFVSMWVWIIIWWLIWDIKMLTSNIDFFLSVFIFSIVALVGCYIIMGISYWIRRNIGKTVK